VFREGAGREMEGVSLGARVHEKTHVAICHLEIYEYLFLIQY
jgi:hypothetical protein